MSYEIGDHVATEIQLHSAKDPISLIGQVSGSDGSIGLIKSIDKVSTVFPKLSLFSERKLREVGSSLK